MLIDNAKGSDEDKISFNGFINDNEERRQNYKEDDEQFTKIVPIIFSHGLVSYSGHYTGHCRELASHGYIVFAIDHLDGSSTYTECRKAEAEKGKPKPFSFEFKMHDYKVRSFQ